MSRTFQFGWTILLALAAAIAEGAAPPNVVIIYADDIGYGDPSCYGAKAGLTPNVDRLAKEGLRFTDGHCTSATCTPSRYGLLTGEYPWRKKGTGVLPGDARMIIEPGRTTLATVMRQAGYRTGVVGKWHLGLGAGDLDWNGEITPSPLDIGFDESFIMAATGDRVPCVYVRDRRVVGLDPADPIEVRYGQPIPGEPTGKQNPELLKVHPSHGHDMAIVNGVSRIGHMKGGKKALWVDEEMADVFTKEAVEFVGRHKAKPFFLYFATHDVHVPRVPHPRFVGKSGMGPRGDALLEFDWSVGEILETLDDAGLTENTLVLLSSDNGPVIDDGYRDDAVEKLGDHKPSGPFRGGKYSKFEAGTRVPWIVRWPAKVQPGVSDALMCQVDFLATFAALVGQPTSVATARDSENQLPALLGESKTGRQELVEQGNGLALRDGPWKWIPGSKGPAKNGSTNTELGNAPEGMLFNLSDDPGELNDVAPAHPEVVAKLQSRLTELQN